MKQNLVQLTITPESLVVVDEAIAALEQEWSELIALETIQRRRLTKMGDKSEAFCRKAITVLGENPDVLPANFDLETFRGDLLAYDQLRPRFVRVERLFERANHTQMALGSDLMKAALDGYAIMKVAGRADGLNSLKESLGARFNRRRRKKADEGSGDVGGDVNGAGPLTAE